MRWTCHEGADGDEAYATASEPRQEQSERIRTCPAVRGGRPRLGNPVPRTGAGEGKS